MAQAPHTLVRFFHDPGEDVREAAGVVCVVLRGRRPPHRPPARPRVRPGVVTHASLRILHLLDRPPLLGSYDLAAAIDDSRRS
ncbi:hypothetical protein AB0O01_35175 [Streptomyces sp. NPDC093252]|uniref:hypothetical protein n=1 Tax=Streptomyces sp. NPDC093252 TaxID=3154980 RepID=UPI00341FBE48